MKVNMEIGSVVNGFRLIEIDNLDEYRSLGLHFSHEATGLKLYHIYNDDKENTFSFSFNTPINCSNGVPHIVEHSVLSGSRKYDLKDPFQAMMSGSVNTFLNAYTFPDKTAYPASSILEKDFFNLMSVYGDAVFFPKMTKETFLQEGWRLCVDEDGELSYSGVVYNEMKGVYSSHESIVADMSVKSLFSTGTYSHDSGGDPTEIPNLTYDEFINFHKKWYHPSNCYFYLYGDIPTEKTLKFLDENFLKDFEATEVDGITWSDEKWDEPRTFHRYTPAIKEKKNGSDLLISWKLFDMSTPEDALALEVLHRILLGTSASPLHKALVESDLWEDLSSASGLENELCNFVYTVGVRGAEVKRTDDFRNVVFSTLNNLITNGIDKDLIEGALRSIEFRNREIQGSFGLRLMRKVLRGWLHGYSPVTTLEFEKWMTALREDAHKKGFFEKLIRKYLLDNNHRADIVIEPSVKEGEKEKSELQKALGTIKENLSKKDIEVIRKINKDLLEYQNKPDSNEAIESLPRLTRDDIPSDILKINTIKEDFKGFNYYKTDLYTNGIVYFGIGFNMEYLDKFFFEYLLIFTRMLTMSGFKGVPYDEVSKRVSLILGGIGASMETSNTLKDGKPNFYIENMYLRAKVLEHSLEEGVALALDFLTRVDFHDYNRLKSVIVEIRNDLKASLVPSGSSYAALRSARKFSLASCREESWYGVTQAQFLEDLVSGFDREGAVEEVATVLDSIRRELITRQGLFFHGSSDKEYESRLKNAFDKVIDALPEGKSHLHPAEHYDIHESVEGLIGNSKVSYTGVTIRSAFLGTKEYASSLLLSHMLKTGYLWENVRMKGGAYGVFVSPAGLDGAITFGSYRDPNINKTLYHFRHCLEWIAAGHINQKDIDMALVSVVGKELKPMTPLEKSIIGMRRDILGISDTLRKEKRKYLMNTTKEDLMDFAAVLLHNFDEASTVILSSEDALMEASEELEGLKENLTHLPG